MIITAPFKWVLSDRTRYNPIFVMKEDPQSGLISIYNNCPAVYSLNSCTDG